MKCPFCLDVEMKAAEELKKGWYKCPNCGGTEVTNPTVPRGDGGISGTWRDGAGELHYRASRARKKVKK